MLEIFHDVIKGITSEITSESVPYIPTAEDVRADRGRILTLVVDPLVSNPLRWGDLTSEQQQAWAEYRRALLDIPQQSGFPDNVIWPIEP